MHLQQTRKQPNGDDLISHPPRLAGFGELWVGKILSLLFSGKARSQVRAGLLPLRGSQERGGSALGKRGERGGQFSSMRYSALEEKRCCTRNNRKDWQFTRASGIPVSDGLMGNWK